MWTQGTSGSDVQTASVYRAASLYELTWRSHFVNWCSAPPSRGQLQLTSVHPVVRFRMRQLSSYISGWEGSRRKPLLTMRLRFILSAIQTVLEKYCFISKLLKPGNVVFTTDAVIQLDIRWIKARTWTNNCTHRHRIARRTLSDTHTSITSHSHSHRQSVTVLLLSVDIWGVDLFCFIFFYDMAAAMGNWKQFQNR